MMSLVEVTGALQPFLSTFGAKLDPAQWEQYGLALRDVSPGDLDDALADLRKSHAFRNAPLPAEILDRCDVHRKRRIVDELPVEKFIKADPSEGEWKTFTIAGLGSVRMHVLPDDHPALRRYACLTCKDTGWAEGPKTPMGNDSVYRCGCIARNPVLKEQRMRNAEQVKKRT